MVMLIPNVGINWKTKIDVHQIAKYLIAKDIKFQDIAYFKVKIKSKKKFSKMDLF